MTDQKHGDALVWSIVLAGGEGERVKPLVQRWLGRHHPKQYCTFVGTRSMFQHTVDRAAQVSTLRRTVVVAARHHEAELRDQLDGRPIEHLLLQPANCDTAAGVFLPLTYVRARDPKATVVLLPSDHFVYPEARFLRLVRQALQAAEGGADRLVLLGVRPDRLELEYGWIEPAPEQAGENLGGSMRRVRRFLEKPEPAQADEAMRNGALWNTLVLAAKAELLWELGRRCFPEIHARFQQLGEAIGGPREAAVLAQIYEEMPHANFSAGLLQRLPEAVAVLELDGVLWSDWGKPERIAETLRRIDKRPAFPAHCLDQPFAPHPVPPRAEVGWAL
ncbi:MAG: NTP transferase domain-containing protein [Nitrospira sp.]|nr:NTP transferase domain-containing protein [Nitrospira sp.]